jgi:hypothetical protein
LNALSTFEPHCAPILAHVPVEHRSIVRVHACLHAPVVVAHALRHVSSAHAASHAPHCCVQPPVHEPHVDSQAPLHARDSSSQSFVMHAWSYESAHANTFSSWPGPGSGGGGTGVKSQLVAMAVTTRGSVHPFGKRVTHACGVGGLFLGAEGGAGAADADGGAGGGAGGATLATGAGGAGAASEGAALGSGGSVVEQASARRAPAATSAATRRRDEERRTGRIVSGDVTPSAARAGYTYPFMQTIPMPERRSWCLALLLSAVPAMATGCASPNAEPSSGDSSRDAGRRDVGSVSDGGTIVEGGSRADGRSMPDGGPLADGGDIPDAGTLADGGDPADGSLVGPSPITIAQVRSVTFYNFSETEFLHPTDFEVRLQQAKQLGFNTIWLVVPWDDLESNVGTDASIAIGAPGYDGTLNSTNVAALRAGLQLVKLYGLNIMWSVDYAGVGWAPTGIDPTLMVIAPNLQFLLRYTVFVTKLLVDAGLAHSTFMLFHDEGVLGPYDALRGYPTMQQEYDNYLFARNPALSYWNTRWNQSYTDWSQVQTFSFSTSGYLDPQLQDTVGFINWELARSIGNGSFTSAIKTISPDIRVGYHYTDFNFLDTRTSNFTQIDSPLLAGNGFDFVSFPLYDSDPISNPFKKGTGDYVADAQGVFPGMPVFVGELGSDVCALPGDCTYTSTAAIASATLDNRQAQFIGRNITSMVGLGVGFNIWNLHDFPIGGDSTAGILGLLNNDGTSKPSGALVGSILRGSPASLDTLVPQLTTAGVTPGATPWEVWVDGSQLESGDMAMLVVSGSVWANVSTTLAADGTWLSFTLPSDSLPGSCNATSVCPMQVILWSPSAGLYSSPLTLSIPAP